MRPIAMATRSERGAREGNEDALAVGRAGSGWFAVLADGAGGHAGGARASRIAVEGIGESLRGAAAQFRPELLTAAIEAAHRRLQQAQAGASGRERMHTTAVALWIDGAGERALWSHVGDSRLYLVRRAAVATLTRDDSVVQRLLDAGLLTAEQARRHPHKNQLLAALGIDDAVEPHTPPLPLPLEDGDAFLLCSDGWWDGFDDAAIAGLLAGAATPAGWLDAMKQQIERRQAPQQDNFSAIAVWIGDPTPTLPGPPGAGLA